MLLMIALKPSVQITSSVFIDRFALVAAPRSVHFEQSRQRPLGIAVLPRT
jgi:hypothetical protein